MSRKTKTSSIFRRRKKNEKSGALEKKVEDIFMIPKKTQKNVMLHTKKY